MKAICVSVLLLVVFATAEPSLADDTSNAFSKLPAVKVIVEELKHKDCGISETDIETSARYVLAQSKVILNDSLGSVVYVNVNVASSCQAANVTVDLERAVKILGNNSSVLATVWNDGSLLTGSGQLPSRIENEVEQIMKTFVVNWAASNR